MKGQKSALLAASFLILAALGAAGCQQPVEAPETVRPVKTIVLADSNQTSSRSFPGIVRASQRAKLSFRVAGPLVALPVFEGQQVTKGQLLARIDPRDFETDVRNLEARLADLNAQRRAMERARPEDIRRLEAGLAAAQSKLLEATASYRRYQRLYENDNVSKAEFDQARAGRDVAEAEVQSATESLSVARSGARPEDLEAMEARIRSMEAQLQIARDQLKDTELRAPYDGIIAERYVDNYEFVSAFKDIVSLQNASIVEIVAQIPEGLAAMAKRGQRTGFKARFPSISGLELDARPSELSAEADPVTRTYDVTFQALQPESVNLFAGMTAEIEIPGLGEETAGWLVPVAAVFADAAGSNVWVLDEGSDRPRKVQVRLGEPSGEGIRIMSGLETGMTVITAGAQFLNESQRVRPITDELRDRQ